MIKNWLANIKAEAYKEGYGRGLSDGVRSERFAIIRTLEHNTDMAAFQETAKNKTTKIAADGMQIGFEHAVALVMKRIDA